MASEWIDISVSLHSGMVHWPDNPTVEFERVLDMNRGDVSNVSNMSLGSHTGTHMDAPIHFISGGKGLYELPLDTTVGPARVVEIIDKERISIEELQIKDIRRDERILFKTLNSTMAWKSETLVEDFVYISQEAARYLSALPILAVGVDYLSVGGFKKDAVQTHRALLEAGIWIIEGLDLSGVEPGTYDLICHPLKIVNGDGAPARAIVRKKQL